MRYLKQFVIAGLFAGLLAAPFVVGAADKKTAEKTKPYPLNTCVVSGEKLGEMGDPYVFSQDGQEIKLCCKSCLKDFKKNPAMYLKKVEAASPKTKKS